MKKYNFDMMELTSEKDGLYCSVHCLKNCGKRITPRPTGKATKSVPLRSVYVPQIANKRTETRTEAKDRPYVRVPASAGIACTVLPSDFAVASFVLGVHTHPDKFSVRASCS